MHYRTVKIRKTHSQFSYKPVERQYKFSINGYICAVLSGSLGKSDQANAYIKASLKIIAAQTKKKNPIEIFAVRRLEYFKKNPIKTVELCQLLCVEMLFLWICLPYCTEEKLRKMLDICDVINEKHFVAFKCLFEGAIRIELKDADYGEQVFN